MKTYSTPIPMFRTRDCDRDPEGNPIEDSAPTVAIFPPGHKVRVHDGKTEVHDANGLHVATMHDEYEAGTDELGNLHLKVPTPSRITTDAISQSAHNAALRATNERNRKTWPCRRPV